MNNGSFAGIVYHLIPVFHAEALVEEEIWDFSSPEMCIFPPVQPSQGAPRVGKYQVGWCDPEQRVGTSGQEMAAFHHPYFNPVPKTFCQGCLPQDSKISSACTGKARGLFVHSSGLLCLLSA